MESLANKLIKSGYNVVNPKLFKEIESLEDKFYELENDHLETIERMGELRHERNELLKDDQNALVDISKKLSTTLKSLGEDEMLKELMLQRAKIMDHFTMAYLTEMELKPSQIKLIQSVNENNEIEMYFEKHSLIIV